MKIPTTEGHTGTIRSVGPGLLVVTMSLLLAGCLSRPALVQQKFGLQTPAVPSPAANPVDGTLQFRSCRVAPQYASREFVYRTGTNSYETDPYACFLVAPDNAFTAPIRDYLAGTGLFDNVTDPDNPGNAVLALDVNVDELYGDFRNPGKPAITLSLRVSVVGVGQKNAGKSIFEKRYSKHLSISQNTAAAVVAGWNQALGEILGDMTSELADACKKDGKSSSQKKRKK